MAYNILISWFFESPNNGTLKNVSISAYFIEKIFVGVFYSTVCPDFLVRKIVFVYDPSHKEVRRLIRRYKEVFVYDPPHNDNLSRVIVQLLGSTRLVNFRVSLCCLAC